MYGLKGSKTKRRCKKVEKKYENKINVINRILTSLGKQLLMVDDLAENENAISEDLATAITDYAFSAESDEDFKDINPVILIQWDISGD